MAIGLRELAVLPHGHRSPADVVIEPADRLLHDARPIISGRITGQDGLRSRHQKERTFQGSRWLVLEQIGMEGTIGRRQPEEEQVEHRPGLPGVTEGRLTGRQRLEPLGKKGRHAVRSIVLLHDRATGGSTARFRAGSRLHAGKQLVQRPPDGRIERPGGKIQIAQHDSGRVVRTGPLPCGSGAVLEIVWGIVLGFLPHRHHASLFHGLPGAARASGTRRENRDRSIFAGPISWAKLV